MSSVGMKILMAVSGLYFIFYVLMHMYGNLKVLAGQEAFDNYAHHLRTMLEPILPYTGFLWLFRLTLIVALLAHLYSAFSLWSRAGSARQERYRVKKAIGASISSKWMRWGGVTLLLFVIFHLLHFTIAKINFNGNYSESQLRVNGVESPYLLLVAAFKVWWLVLIYLIALVALGMHIHHGTWSAMQTLGFTDTARARNTAKAAGTLLAAVVVIGFAIPPLAVLFGAGTIK
ncbi:MAG: succinate dehydrogenase cytochrome b subunit [Austwickia sp.]|nr:succinate dehydrogenase cytochrome b subunit [Austwickia sp.]